MSDTSATSHATQQRGPSGLLTPAASAIAGFTLAAVALLGQNAVTAAVSSLLGPNMFSGQTGFTVAWGVAVLIQAGLAWLLARRAVGPGTGWVDGLARAALVVAALAVVAGALLVVGGLLQEAGLYY